MSDRDIVDSYFDEMQYGLYKKEKYLKGSSAFARLFVIYAAIKGCENLAMQGSMSMEEAEQHLKWYNTRRCQLLRNLEGYDYNKMLELINNDK